MNEKICYLRIMLIIMYFHLGIKPEKVVCLKQNLHDGRNYLKLDYRTHISNNSSVGDHCSTFGLSDKSKLNWRKICDHDHIEEYIILRFIY